MSKPKDTPPNLAEKDIQRFWSKVNKEPGQGPKGDCWEWQAFRTNRGYGLFASSHRRGDPASRIALYLKTGEWPKYNACHTCDNPPCCNPAHLYDGTHKQNAEDRNSRDRQSRGAKHGALVRAKTQRGEAHWTRYLPEQIRRGEENGDAKLTTAQVLEIRQKWATGYRNKAALAREYAVSPPTIARIIRRENWKHI